MLAGNTTVLVFLLCVLLVFLVLAAQYESWAMPLSVILIVPLCLLCALAGIWLTGGDNNIFTQVWLPGAHRPGLQERHPDRGVRTGTGAPRPHARGRGHRGLDASGCGPSS